MCSFQKQFRFTSENDKTKKYRYNPISRNVHAEMITFNTAQCFNSSCVHLYSSPKAHLYNQIKKKKNSLIIKAFIITVYIIAYFLSVATVLGML